MENSIVIVINATPLTCKQWCFMIIRVTVLK